MTLSKTTVKKIKTVAILLVAYITAANLFIYLKILGLEELEYSQSEAITMLLPLSTTLGIEVALSIAVLEFYVFSRWTHWPFLKFVIVKYVLLTVTIVFIAILIYLGFEIVDEGESFQALVKEIPRLLKNGFFISSILYMLLFSILFNLLKTVSEYLGPQAIASALFGKYHHPTEEDITFIFIDLKSSTSIAERLGHVKYSLLIDRCFQLLTESIYKYDASVYQFVGDEAVLVWKAENASKDLGPIRLYFDFINRLQQNKDGFLKEFSEMPHFRASIHSGMVAITEIHSIKKDIVYHGDVLNTCSRIMSYGSQLNKDLLVSSIVAHWLNSSSSFSASLTDTVSLRGKDEATRIYQVVKI